MPYVLAVGNTATVPVSFTMPHQGKKRKFDFTLTCERLGVDEWQQSIVDASGDVNPDRIKEKLLAITTGWCDRQDFVCEEGGKPAEFCDEAFSYMLNQPGLLMTIFTAYGKACAITAKNS